MDDISIFTQDLNGGGTLYILIGGLNSNNPVEFMDKQVSQIVKGMPYSEFVDKHMDNPYIRVIIMDINKLTFDESHIIRQ